MITPSIYLSGYHITEQLYAGSRTLVYRGYQAQNQRSVVVKLLKHEHPSFSDLVQFRNQYTLTRNLEIPSIIQPYSLEPYRNGYALVMEDFGGISLRHFNQGRSLTLDSFFAIALQLTDTLHLLHQQRIIHKDIKPANILIHPDTHQIKLIDFSIASLLPRETQAVQSPNGLEGTLAYLSPEQTGRMNRGIDYRSDFYSLGVTCFELLTGQLPFQSSDPMELVHCHLAKPPLSVCDLNPELPLMVGEIIRKLMAKNAEDRYQSAIGLKHDLVTCQRITCERQMTGKQSWFELGQHDISDRFLIPEKLYGRESEVQTLLEAFGRVANGAAEMMLVAGFSGIGKTAVVNEVHKPIVRWNGYFIKGKYDQFQRDIPFSAFVQAFRDLIGQLLSESDAQLAVWRSKILSAVGENGQVLLEVIPELQQMLGPQLPVPELAGSAAQNRFNLLFQTFIQVFTTADHPLVIFIDDLQWADSASLHLIKLLLSQSKTGYLLLLGAYRDNEVFAAHPLMLTLQEMQKAKATLNTITLTALSPGDINQLVAETLNCSIERAQPLTELVYQKTQGNPFFTNQFLKALHEDKLITFVPPDPHQAEDTGGWQCDIAQVRSLCLTDDVVEFMAIQLQKLPAETQNVLKLAACIGNQFDLNTLAIVHEKPQTETAADLWKALQEGLILPQSEVYKFYQESAEFVAAAHSRMWDTGVCAYKFLHDRVQQAAYSLIPDDQKQITHRQIGRLLQQATPAREWDEKLFAIVNHLNQGIALIEQESEQQELAQLNLAAGCKAKGATAYAAALDYFNTGIALLQPDRWQRQYDLSLALYEGATESAYLSTDFEQMQQLVEVVLHQARSWLDRVNIYAIQIQANIAQNQHLTALHLARQVLQPLGVNLPEQPTQAEIAAAAQHSQTLLNGRSIESLLELPLMTAPDQKAAMVILSNIHSAAYQVAPDLLPLIAFAQVDLSVQYGNAAESTYGYVQYGLMRVVAMADIEAGYRFGQVGINLLKRLHTARLAARTIFGFNVSLRHWQEPAKATLDGLLQAYASGLETGDIEYAALSLMCYDYTAYFSGQELSALRQTMSDHRKVIQQLRQDAYFHIHSIYYQAVLNLLETTAEPDRLSGEYYTEATMIQLHLEAKQLLALFQIYFNKLLLSYLFQRHEQALENARLAEQYLGAAVGLLHIPLFYFYDALVQLAIYPEASQTAQTSILERVAAHQEKLSEWAAYAPSNQAHRQALVAAEGCRVLRQKAEAIDLYDRAIALAQAHEYLHEAALANELAAKFYLDWGKERIAQEYLIAAYYGYARWGATAKVADLESRYPQLLSPILQQATAPLSTTETIFASTKTSLTSSANDSASVALDLAAVLKVSQTLSSEIELDKLLATLLRVVMENAGADRGVLLLSERGELMLRAVVQPDEDTTLLSPQPLAASSDLPISLINIVKRNLKPAVIINATVHPQFAKDAYIQKYQPKSLLCSPIVQQGKLLGVLYLENHLTTGAFTCDRVELLNLLCTQAAISLENAQLYQQSLTYAQQLEQSLANLQTSETRLQNLAANLPGMIHQIRVAADGSTSVPYVSSGCVDLYEVSAADLLTGKADLRAMEHPDDRAAMTQSLQDSAQTLAPFEQEFRIITPTGSVKWVHVASRPERQADGSIVWDGMILDISDRKRLELDRQRAETALNQRTAELEQTLQELQRTQGQMVQAEKMSGLGQLVAGVAHEINNPVNFIFGNLSHANSYTTDILELLELYQRCYPSPHPEVAAKVEAIDLDFLLEDLPKILSSMRVGAERIQKIVASLRTFSRMDEAEVKAVDIHDGIDSTLMILQHRLRAKPEHPAIEVSKVYGDLPLVECYAGQLNQVFMNVLSNAIDALEEKMQSCALRSPIDALEDRLECQLDFQPVITIQTVLSGQNHIQVCIADNGPGIPSQIKSRLFDPFFTTKAVGKGTGMGLSISHQIVTEKHKGSFQCRSAPGQGSEFVIEIPLSSNHHSLCRS